MAEEEIKQNDQEETPGDDQIKLEAKEQDAYYDPLEQLYLKLKANKRLIPVFRSILKITGVLLAVSFVFFFIIYIVPGLQQLSPISKTKLITAEELSKDQNYRKQTALLERDVQRLNRKFSSFTSGLSYIVINTIDNRFFLYRNKKMIREGFCSSGSYTMLKTQGEKKWIFKTPKGRYHIQGKTTSPVWKKPDWAFVEEGLPVPPKDDPSRWEYGVLGDYALSIGDGYLIHGTLYKRFLGMPVTHGCVRLNDDDLEAIYNTLSIGSKVYIF
jgi:lipoprotein-anchoring transpeptidase ErfK/SrfK